MKTKKMITCFVVMILAIGAFSQTKVAVLDAIIHSGVQESVAIPITESIIEALVDSGKYKVLDRAHVTRVMEEQKFQVSGIVKDSDIKKVGEYLGADIVVVINVSILEDIYFVSAKMIMVESGEILNQASAKKRGDIGVIFDIASRVGTKIAGTDTGNAVIDTTEPDLINFVGGDLGEIELEVTADDYLVFHVYDMMVSGMIDKEIHVEFWISQGDEWMPDSMQYFEPELVIYDPAYWRGRLGSFTYDLYDVQAFGDPALPYWASFFIIDTATNETIFQKDLKFDLPALEDDILDWDFFDEPATPTPPPGPKVRSRLSLNYTYPVFMGNVNDVLEDIEWVSEGTVSPTFLDLHLLQVLSDEFHVSLLAAYNTTYWVSDIYYDEEGDFLSGINLQVGGGYIFPLIPGLQGYSGARFGMYILEQGDAWGITAYNTQTGFSITLEAGFDLILMDILSLNLRAQYESAMFVPDSSDPEAIFPTIALGTWDEDADFYSLDAIGIVIGVGFVY